MIIGSRPLSKNVFLVSRDGGRPILYAPLQGVVLEVNDSYVDRFSAALQGDADAAAALGLAVSTIEKLVTTPEDVQRRLHPHWPGSFEPASATLFLTHRCTLRCAYCYCHGGQGPEMPWPVLERAVRFAANNACRQKRDLHLSFHGGDVGACWPLFQDCVSFVEKLCADLGIRPVLALGTNGFYARDQAEYIAEHVVGATVSLDGTPDLHDAFRATASGRPSSARVLDSIRIFEAAGLDYSIRMTITRDSLPRLSECVEFICQNTRARMIRAEPLYCRGRAAKEGLVPPDAGDFVERFRAAGEVAANMGRSLTYSGARFSGVFGSFCSYPSPTFGVTPEGNLTCCYEVLHPDDPLHEHFFYGHIPADGSSVIVDEERVAAIRARAAERQEACAHCFCVFACAGDCAAKVADASFPDAGLSSRCRITRALMCDMLVSALAGKSLLQSASAPVGGGA